MIKKKSLSSRVTRFFTFVIPFGSVNYLPLMHILDKKDGTKGKRALFKKLLDTSACAVVE
ncbi:hypothetical protein CULT_370013 [[Clostridium] ultunense Esp]|nr:hypothetical protein CULT_370013 [[Clostridium] ultunense Esp]